MKNDSANQPKPPARWANDDDWIEPAEKIPIWAKPFVGKTPAQFLKKYFPGEKLDALAGAMSGFVDIGVPLPEWAKKASIQFWKHYIGTKPLRPFESVEDFGVMVVMVEKIAQGQYPQPQPVVPQSKFEKFFINIAKKLISVLTKKIISKLSHTEKAQFHTGCSRGEEVLAKLQNTNHTNMTPLADVYLAVCVAWRKVESFETHAERIHWLKANKVVKKVTTGDEVEVYQPSDRAVYQAFETIGLSLSK